MSQGSFLYAQFFLSHDENKISSLFHFGASLSTETLQHAVQLYLHNLTLGELIYKHLLASLVTIVKILNEIQH